ncbi:MAG: crossover junction endodeoxyribonuclease RuvC [Clostridia bacterium]|nr:crossover junction endodeoxyribonuclease RuvC [Clostridia bacterium]
MRVLGIDPGIAIVGWGVIDSEKFKYRPVAYDSIMTAAGLPVEQRLSSIYTELSAIIEKYSPDAMAVEELFWNTNQKTGIVVAEARGVILLCARQHGVPIFEYTPLQVKQSVVGYGRAEKKQVITMVTTLLKLPKPPKPDDTADALALAVCHANVGESALSKYMKL